MRTSFVTCSGKPNYEPFRNQPLGIFHLLTILEEGFGSKLDLSLIDLRGISENNAIYHIPERDIYMHSVTSWEFPETRDIVRKIREQYPQAKHIAGGPHVNIFPKESTEVFDAICLGEGEESIKRIINDCFNSSLKRVYNQEEKIDINQYPYPLRKYLPKSAIVVKRLVGGEYSDLPGTSVLFSRGCPFNCYFCANLTQGSTKFRSPDLIKQEIEYLKKEYGVKALAIKDDNSIPVNKKIARPILETIAKTEIVWRGQSRANGVDPDMVKLAKQSGCDELGIGIESVSQRVLDISNKKINLEEAKKYLRTLKKEGIGRRLHLILGLPGEPKDIAQKTIDFIKEVEPSSVLLSLLCPSPGSEFYEHPEKFGIKFKEGITFDQFSTAFGRFDEKEKSHMVFEYEKITPFGESLNENEILENHEKVQSFLRVNGFNF